MPETLKFVLKGNRNYVHGTSLFNAFVGAAKQRGISEGMISVSFKHTIQNPLCILEERELNIDDAATARLVGPTGESITLCINQAQETHKGERQKLDEVEVCRGAVINGKSIVQEKPHHMDRIELLVSLCKKMHQNSVDASKKWVFSRYEGHFPIPEPDRVEIRISKQVGTRLTCSDVFVNGQKIGDMYFS